jgi:hypothetical protein
MNPLIQAVRKLLGAKQGRPEYYEYWVDCIQDCLCQIAGEFDRINPGSGACKHLCEETYIDFSIYADDLISSGYNDIPKQQRDLILELSHKNNLENAESMKMASVVLQSDYFLNRTR